MKPAVSLPPRDGKTGLVASLPHRQAAGRSQPLLALRRRWQEALAQPSGGRRTAGQLYDLTRQLAILLRAGVPLVRALQGLAADLGRTRLARVVEQLAARITAGGSLAQSLAAYPALFDPLYRALVAAGEASGTLEESLRRLAGYMGKRLKLRDQVVSALAYPILVVVVGTGVVLFLTGYVVPRIVSVLLTSGRPLPWPTQALMAASSAIRTYWPVGLGILAALVLARGILARQEALLARWDRWRLRLPIYGKLALKETVARLSQLMGTLLEAGVPMGQALELAATASSNRALAALLRDARRQVQAGRGLAAALEAGEILPRAVVQVLSVGEASGELASALTQLADDYQREVDLYAGRFTALLEPILIVTLAVVVGFIVLATLLPILELTSDLQGYKGASP